MSDLVALYALDALEGSERESFEAHLSSCGECQQSLADYRAITSSLVPDEPASDSTWQRISGAINEEETPAETVVSLRRSQTSTWIAGIAAVVALVFGGLLVLQSLDSSPVDDNSIVASADRAAQSPTSIVADFQVEDATVASVILGEDGRGYVIPEGLEPLDPARTYQLWVINREGDVISAGVLGASPAPATFTWTGGVSGFALTREVAGGVVSSAGDVVSVVDGL